MAKGKYFLLNERIKEEKLRVIGPEGENLGILEREKALEEAKKRELDLILIAEKANPPVAKILDFRKFLYEKRQERKKAKAKRIEIKELRFGPNIGEHDLKVKIKRGREFLEQGNKIKLTVVFRGREITHKEVGQEKLKKVMSEIGDVAEYEREPYFEGKKLMAVVRKR